MRRLADSTALYHPKTSELTFLEAGSEVPSWASELVGDHLLAEPDETVAAVEPEPELGEAGLSSMNLPALKALAVERGIDLGAAKKKAEIVAAIEAADEPDETPAGDEPSEDETETADDSETSEPSDGLRW